MRPPRGRISHVRGGRSGVLERARLGPGGVGLGGVEQPRVHPRRASPSGTPPRFDSYAARLARCPASGTTRDFSSTPRDTRTSRSTARATTPLCEANGAASASSAWATAATSMAGRPPSAASTSATARSLAADVGVPRPAEPVVRRATARRRRCAAAPAPGAATATASAPRTAARPRRGPRPAATSSPDPPRTSSSEDAEPSSTALTRGHRGAATPRSSPVPSSAARGRGACASMPSRAAAYADGTPSRARQRS